ncbi:MAG: hypothetical protein M1822_003027 [Bathelium mastoideum]|nr:MAG: hypothetical protein M1822_003027 [Bathelium mastoideum]
MQPFLASTRGTPVPFANSEGTQMYESETDFEDDESEFEEDSLPSSLESDGKRRSQTTISTYDEVATPHSSRRSAFEPQLHEMKPVEGPRGPHLFRSSQHSSELTYNFALQLSPLVPKQPPPRLDTAFSQSTVVPAQAAYNPPSAAPELDFSGDVQSWTSHQVAAWMADRGIDSSIIERFELNDINGSILLDLQFEDLKELDIQSFGKRHQLWNEIEILRGNEGSYSPAPTPFQDTSRPCTTVNRKPSKRHHRGRHDEDEEDDHSPTTPGGSHKRRGRKHRAGLDDAITPAESVSIVAIEQLIPKPHKCAKGDRCAKFRKQQRLIRQLRQEHGYPISPEKGGHIFIAGDPGNATTAQNIADNVYRPTSEAIPSVVASSDLLGPSQVPALALQEDNLQSLEQRDPQENVKQFLNFQHMQPPVNDPPTPLEMFPPLRLPFEAEPTRQDNFRSLPRLEIPQHRPQTAQPYISVASPMKAADTFSPCHTAMSPPSAMSPNGFYRMGTPASEMDVAVTALPQDPTTRDTSQSVPPNMQFRDPVTRTGSRTDWRRPSFALPRLEEGTVFSPMHDPISRSQSTVNTFSPSVDLPPRSQSTVNVHPLAQHQLPPRSQSTVNVLPPTHRRQYSAQSSQAAFTDNASTVGPSDISTTTATLPPGVAHAGWMKKRKTKLLRHDWHDQHFRLRGTQLSAHRDALPSSTALATIDVDDYAVACSSIASKKLATRLKALSISNSSKAKNGESKDPAFEFQLVPELKSRDEKERKVLLKKGESHHFAVKSRDERIDWMRELMLAKALKQKEGGYEVNVNGAAI